MTFVEKEKEIKRLRIRLAAHRRRLSYWSGNPSLSGYGPTGKKLGSGIMDLKYELAKCDAHSIASLLADLGVNERVIGPRETFQARYHDPKAEAVYIWPQQNA